MSIPGVLMRLGDRHASSEPVTIEGAMLLSTWRLLIIMVTAVSMSCAVAYLFEMPANMDEAS